MSSENLILISSTQFFGPDWHTPSPTILYIDSPSDLSQPTAMWTKLCETLSRIFTYRVHGTHTTISSSQVEHETTEAGLLYLGIKQGWDCIPYQEWPRYPALELLKEVDGLVFSQLPKIERLAIGYKSLKLLTVGSRTTVQTHSNYVYPILMLMICHFPKITVLSQRDKTTFRQSTDLVTTKVGQLFSLLSALSTFTK